MKQKTTQTRSRWLLVCLLSLLMTLSGSSPAWADELTVYDETAHSAYVPLYGYYADTNNTKSEFIIPSSQLSSMSGGTISKMAFFMHTKASTAWNGTWKVFIKEVNVSYYASATLIGDESSTMVYTGTLDATGDEMEITFDNSYIYGGGNLLVGIYLTTKGTNSPNAEFYGTSSTGGSIYNYGSYNTKNIVNFIPKTKFTYEPLTGPGFAVDEYTNGATVSFGKIAANAAKNITLKNPGTEAVTVNIETTGGFTAATSKTIAAGGQETLTITAPDATANGTIVMTPTAGGVAAITLNLSCVVIDPARMMADFTGNTWPEGWTYTNNNNGWKFYEGAVYYWNSSAYSSTPTNDIVTSKFTVTGGDVLMFDAYKNSAAYNDSYVSLKVFKSTDGETWGDPIASYTGANMETSFKSFTIESIPAGSYYFKFTANQICLDNIYGLLPAVEPKNLAVSRAGTDATFTWDAANTETAWQVYIDTDVDAISGSITPIDVATTPSKTFTGLTVGNTYYVWVRSNFGGDSYSDWVRTSFSLTYRAAAPTSVDGSGITNVTFGSGAEVLNSNDRPTSSPYYGDYSAQIGGATAGQSSNLAITFSTGYGYGTVVWVDWNQNYELEDSEIVFAGECGTSKPTTLDASFTIPALQAAGNYRMRIAAADSYYDSHKTMVTAAGADPYPTGTYCVVHDYTLKVNEAADYSMSITGGDVVSSTIAFGTVKNTTSTKTFTITNDGGSDLTSISVVSSDAEVFTVSDTGFDLASGATKDITVTFVKAVENDYNETITISQVNVATPIVLTATATYVTPTPATMNATLDDVAIGASVDFGTVNKATVKTFKVTNTGEATLNATITITGTDAAKFTPSTTSLVVAGESNETFTITFNSDDEDVAKTATVTLSAAGLSDVSFDVTGTYSNFWTEDFEGGSLPTGWVVAPGYSSGDTYVWHVGTFSSYENKTNMAIAPTGATHNTIVTPRLAAKKDDVLTWDAYFDWYDEYLTVEWSNDGQTGWTAIYNQYTPQSESISTHYYHKEMSFTAPADGNYYLRFTARYSNGVDNFSGFKLNPKTHDAIITSKSIPATGSQYVEYTAYVTVNELLGKDDEVVTAELWIGSTKVATESDVTLNASASKVIYLTFTPDEAISGDAVIKVYNGDNSIDLTSDVQAVEITAALVLDETVNPEAVLTSTGDKPSVVVKYNAKNGWNTICMPFALTSDILTSIFGTGWKIYEFKGYNSETKELSFGAPIAYAAGYPYIVYVETAAPHPEGVKLFDVNVAALEPNHDTYNGATFQGTYAPKAAGSLTGNYGVTTAGKIVKANASASMKGFRGYFTGLPTNSSARLSFEDDATGITTIIDAKELNNDGKVYNLNGQRVENAHKGLYIVNGRKVVVK